jgi:predicted O-methyltransferase YrrM
MADSSTLFSIIDNYIADLFVPPDRVLEEGLKRANDAGLPEIQVSATQGKFLYLLAKLVGARRILEVGTLGGFSTIWLARALPEGGRLITLELDSKHAEVAGKNIEAAGLASKVEIIVGSALETLPKVCANATEPFDVVFLDADKPGYAAYFDQVMKAVRSGSLILADNVIRQGGVLAPARDEADDIAIRAFNAMLAADSRLESVILQQVGIKGHDGIAVSRVK